MWTCAARMSAGVAAGVLLLLAGALGSEASIGTVVRWAFALFGLLTIVRSVLVLIGGFRTAVRPYGVCLIVVSSLGILTGAVMIVRPGRIVAAAAAVCLLALPLLRVFAAERRAQRFLRELPLLLLGAAILLFLPALAGAAFRLIRLLLLLGGCVVTALSLAAGIAAMIRPSSPSRDGPAPPRTYVDDDGDGVVDRVLDDPDDLDSD